jgi:tetratricopeptide (TPR) repeat protein
MVQALDPALVDKIFTTMREGLPFRQQGAFAQAEPYYLQAWAMLPEPKQGWDISDVTIYTIAGLYREWKRFPEAKHWIAQALREDLQPHEFLQHREAGTIYFDAGELETARSYLEHAWHVGGVRAFQGEDPKYLKFLQEKHT